jgi:hypothetical protein
MPRFQVDNTLQTLHLLSSQGFQQVTTPFNRTVLDSYILVKKKHMVNDHYILVKNSGAGKDARRSPYDQKNSKPTRWIYSRIGHKA